jgi:hypothetical protein
MLRSQVQFQGVRTSRFWLTALRLESFQAQFLGRNSLNQHLLCRQRRDVSTPRLGLSEGIAESRRSALHDSVHWHRFH